VGLKPSANDSLIKLSKFLQHSTNLSLNKNLSTEELASQKGSAAPSSETKAFSSIQSSMSLLTKYLDNITGQIIDLSGEDNYKLTTTKPSEKPSSISEQEQKLK